MKTYRDTLKDQMRAAGVTLSVATATAKPSEQAQDAIMSAEEREELEKVLRPFGHFLHGSSGDLGKEDETHGDDPHDDHGVGYREPERSGDLDGLLRERILPRRGEGDGVEGEEDEEQGDHVLLQRSGAPVRVA